MLDAKLPPPNPHTQVLADRLPALDLPRGFAAVTRLDFYLYRSPASRPIEDMNPHHCWLEPENRPFQGQKFEHIGPKNLVFTYHVDRYDLTRLNLLCFHIVVLAPGVIPFAFTTFLKTGGAGGGLG